MAVRSSIPKTAASAFEKLLKAALKHYHQPARLGAESPLAKPYFLGTALAQQTTADDPAVWGAVLCAELCAAAATLWGEPLPRDATEMQRLLQQVRQEPKGKRYSYLVLELKHFHQYFDPGSTSAIYECADFLPGAKATFFVDYDVAIQHLADALLARLRPTFRLEEPPCSPISVGYQHEREQACAALSAGQSVAISGPSGVGKTTLAADLAHKRHSAFWFTIRPGVTDHLQSLLFALGFFLQQRGATQLWRWLMSSQDVDKELHLALGLARLDLAQLTPQPLLCFDEIDRLQLREESLSPPAHRQLFAFLEGLQGVVPLLTIGPRTTLLADCHIELAGLAAPALEELLQQNTIPFTRDELHCLHKVTRGNLRLVMLCLGLVQQMGTLAQALDALPQSPALQSVFYRVWSRLSDAERECLAALSLFRTPAPTDAWLAETVATLQRLRLVEQDGRGGIAVVTVLQELIKGNLAAEQRERLHQQAATICLARTEYTEAAYHFWQGGQENKAVQGWYPHRLAEIRRGQAAVAQGIFQGISRNRLGKAEQSALDLIRAQLCQLEGDALGGQQALAAGVWFQASEATLQASALRADFQNSLGYPEAALQQYGDGIALALRLLTQVARLHYRRGQVAIQQRWFTDAWADVRHAEWAAHTLRGQVQEIAGQLAEASQEYAAALALLATTPASEYQAQTHRNLAILLGQQNRFDEALPHAQTALDLYETLGDHLSVEVVRGNILAGIHLQARNFPAVVAAASDALPYFRAIGNAYLIANTAHNLAEAHFELGNLAQAQQLAEEVLAQETRQVHPYAYFTLGQIQRSQEEWVAAGEHYQQAIRLAQQNQDLFLEAYAQRAWAGILWQQGQPAVAHHAHQRAIDLFGQLGSFAEQSQTATLWQELTNP